MEIIPALSLKNGKVVVTECGEYHGFTAENGNPLPTMKIVDVISSKYDHIFIIDIDALSGGEQQIEILREISDHIDVWVDAGVRSSEHIYDLFIAGAEYVVAGTKSLKDMKELEKMTDVSLNIIFSIDYRNGIISASKDISEIGLDALLTSVKEMEISTVVFLDIGRTREECMNTDIIGNIIDSGLDVYVGGELTSEDVKNLESMGASGVLIEFKHISEIFG